jgi:antitoxin (DNA-binding transcriptional repressor) of toxin-antitoxin stability system
MQTVELVEAQSRLKELVESLAPGDEIVIEKNHKPVARLLSTGSTLSSRPPRPLREFAGKFHPLSKAEQDDLKFHDQAWCERGA